MDSLYGITGTPGTGKKSIAPLAAARMGVSCRSLDELAREAGVDPDPQTGELDTSTLRRRLPRVARRGGVVYGHLLPYVFDRASISRVVVLRCDPSLLRLRLEDRGYPKAKVAANVEAELIGLVSADAYEAFGPSRVRELDTTSRSPAESAAEVASSLSRRAAAQPRIDWTRAYDSALKLRSLLA